MCVIIKQIHQKKVLKPVCFFVKPLEVRKKNKMFIHSNKNFVKPKTSFSFYEIFPKKNKNMTQILVAQKLKTNFKCTTELKIN